MVLQEDYFSGHYTEKNRLIEGLSRPVVRLLAAPWARFKSQNLQEAIFA